MYRLCHRRLCLGGTLNGSFIRLLLRDGLYRNRPPQLVVFGPDDNLTTAWVYGLLDPQGVLRYIDPQGKIGTGLPRFDIEVLR